MSEVEPARASRRPALRSSWTWGVGLDPVDQVGTQLFRALAVLRVVVLVYAVALNAVRWREFAHPAVGWAVVGGMVVWTGVAIWAYDEPRRRTTTLLVVDLAVACAAVLATAYVLSDTMLARNASTLPSFWVMGAVLAWAAARGVARTPSLLRGRRPPAGPGHLDPRTGVSADPG